MIGNNYLGVLPLIWGESLDAKIRPPDPPMDDSASFKIVVAPMWQAGGRKPICGFGNETSW